MMVTEFENRIEAQKEILKIVNRHIWPGEPLFSLTRKAIDRWIAVNRLNAQERLSTLIIDAAGALFFLATKSQEQITEDYQAVEKRVRDYKYKIALEISKLTA